MGERKIREGDTVAHGPSAEVWLVAAVDGKWLWPAGWPESQAKVSDCQILKPATDKEHQAMLRQVADVSGPRGRIARRKLGMIGIYKLKPCPLCGQDWAAIESEKTVRRGVNHTSRSELWWVVCEGCSATGPKRDREDLAVHCWNHNGEDGTRIGWSDG